MDNQTNISELKSEVKEFVRTRDWTKHHSARNLALSISIEAAELLEHYQWSTQEAVAQQLNSVENKSEIAAELADILIYCLSFANYTGIDISEAIREKMKVNHDRFPPSKTVEVYNDK
jgi:dCTP diphosphatase